MMLSFSIMYLLILSILITYIAYTEYVNKQTFLSNHLMSTKSTALAFTDGSVPKVEDLSRYIDKSSGISLFTLLHKTPDLTVYGFLGDEFPKTISFLPRVQNDSEQKRNITNESPSAAAIVGETIAESEHCFTDENGNLHYKFNNNSYIVKNVIATPMNDVNDNVAFIKLNSNDILPTNKIFIDGHKSADIDIAVEFMHEEYKSKVIIENGNFVERYIFSFPKKNMLGFLVAAFVMIVLSSLVVFTLRSYSDEINVKNLVGIPIKRIMLSIEKNILLLTAAATFTFSIIYTCIYAGLLKSYFLNFRLVTILIFAFIFIVFLTLTMYLYILVLMRITR